MQDTIDNLQSSLVRGNIAFREHNYKLAIDFYFEALGFASDRLKPTIQFNLDIAFSRLYGDRKNIDQEKYDKVSNYPYFSVRFDSDYYSRVNHDVRNAGVDPCSHYWSSGESEGRWPNQYFDPVFYSRINADVREAGISPFRHFIDSGYNEGRFGCSPHTSNDRVKSEAYKPLLFVGHDGIQAGSEVVLLEIIKWFFLHTLRRIKLLLLAPGEMVQRYVIYADVYVLPENKVDDPHLLRKFLSDQFEFIYLNTVVSGRFIDISERHGIALDAPVFGHIHEMEKVLQTFGDELRSLKRYVGHWISASPASTKALIDIYGISNDRITTVPAFISPVASKDATENKISTQARKELGISENSFVVMGCGTIYWRKGTDLFVESARHLKGLTNNAITFVWLGEGPDRNDLECSLTIEERGYIKFVGNRADANRLLAAADVFFLSSREDPFPLVVLESAQHGVPSICFREATGITAFIEDNAGLALSRIDSALAAEKLHDLMQDVPLLKRLGDVARRKLFEQYTTDVQLIQLYNAVIRHSNYKPSVSVIIPFYNHESFVRERIRSVLGQTIKDVEIIILDDSSSDHTIRNIQPYLADKRVRFIGNEENSGSPFRQWQKGILMARSDIVWIAEGDDSCDRNFIETLLPYFDDSMINLASARVIEIDENGRENASALKSYLDMARPGKFDSSYINDGFVEINQQLGSICTLVNASAILIRKSSFGRNLHIAQDFKMCGDWLIYLECLKGGKIAHDVRTRGLFRRHSNSQVSKVEGTPIYFSERNSVTKYILTNYYVSKRMLSSAFSAINHEWQRFSYKNTGSHLVDFYDKLHLSKLARHPEVHSHIGLYVHGMLFSKGGIERIAGQLANYLVEKGWRITIYCRADTKRRPIYPLYESVSVVPIFDEHQIDNSVDSLAYALRRDEVDVFVPMLSEWLFEPVVEAAVRVGLTVIVSEHNDPWKIEALWWDHDRRVSTFEKAHGVHLLLNKFKESLPEKLHSKIHVIPNGVAPPNILTDIDNEKLILSVGRLEPQKRYDRLISAVGLIKDALRGSGHRIEIYGDGSLKQELCNQIEKLQIHDLVHLMGSTSDIERIYPRGDFFVFPSDFEGFGIAVVEALSYGLPVIGFKQCNGVNEIVRDGLDGFLVDSVNVLAEVMKRLIKGVEPEMRTAAKSRAKLYSEESFLRGWEDLLSLYEEGHGIGS